MKIAMLGTRGLPATHGGVERAVEELSAQLVAREHRVTVFCRSGYCKEQPRAYRGIALRYLPAISTKHLEAASHTLLSAILAGAGDYDVVHIHSIGPALFSWIPRLAGKKVVVTVHALDWARRKWGPVARLTLRMGAWAAATLPHATIAVSKAASRYLWETHRRRAIHLPNGVVHPTTQQCDVGLDHRDSSGRYVLYLGRLVPEKRVEDLIVAFRRVGAPARLVVAGDGYFSDDYVDDLKRLAAGDPRVSFLGGVYGEAKEALISGASLLVNPSELEGHPIVVLEALSHGVRVLVGNIEEHREILEGEGGTARLGSLFCVRDRRDLTDGIERSLREPDGPSSRAERARFVKHNYDWARIADATAMVYKSLNGRTGSRTRADSWKTVAPAVERSVRPGGERTC